MRKLDLTPDHDSFRRELSVLGVGQDVIEAMVASGFTLTGVITDFRGGTAIHIADTAYGNKQISGLFSFERFLQILNEGQREHIDSPTYEIGSQAELKQILLSERHRPFFESGRMSFRGQNNEYWMKRPFPNPVRAEADGKERLIIPSFWRQFRDDWNKRFKADLPASIFSTYLADKLIYYGLPSPLELSERNFKRYGPHTLSDLEDFDDTESREYGRRWRIHKVIQPSDLFLIEQHYGIETCGLDVTFEPGIALYFATHKFRKNIEGKAYFEAIPRGEHQGVLYAFVFTNPGLTSTRDLVREIGVFDHIPPTRPIRQHCALPGFDAFSFNAAVTDLDAVFYLKPEFDDSDLPQFLELFPDSNEDPFYEALLTIRKENPKVLEGLVEYA